MSFVYIVFVSRVWMQPKLDAKVEFDYIGDQFTLFCLFPKVWIDMVCENCWINFYINKNWYSKKLIVFINIEFIDT